MPAIVFSCAWVTVTLPLVSAPFRSKVTAAGPETRLLPESKTRTCQFTAPAALAIFVNSARSGTEVPRLLYTLMPASTTVPVAASAGRLPPIFIAWSW